MLIFSVDTLPIWHLQNGLGKAVVKNVITLRGVGEKEAFTALAYTKNNMNKSKNISHFENVELVFSFQNHTIIASGWLLLLAFSKRLVFAPLLVLCRWWQGGRVRRRCALLSDNIFVNQ